MVEEGWRADVTPKNHVVLTRFAPPPKREAVGAKADPVMLEIFNNLFMSIAEQMGVTLQNTAYSVNIKERLDFSCAVFDRDGSLVANAPHMPVHLGSMDRSVETIIRDNAGRIRPGDVFVLNAPYNGGTHLPDITVCTPVFDDRGESLLFWVASRGHHADIGGVAPGSMSPRATTIHEEGIYIDNFLLVERGVFRERELVGLLTGGPWPARNPTQNVNDLKAQIAANEKGARELRRMIAHFGLATVEAYMGHVQDNAEESVRRVIDRLVGGEAELVSDQGAVIRVRITVDRERREATVDFTGTSAQQPSNFNAPEPVTRAATLYVFRVMVDDDIPMNAGCLKPIRVILPEGSMLSPRYPAAVVAGNVEVSQAVTDTLFAALGALGSAQGTMNNLTFGDATLSVLRNHLLGRSGRSGLRRRGGRAYAHDQLAPDRPRDSGEPLPGGAGGFSHPPRLGRQGRAQRWRRDAAPHSFPEAHAGRGAQRPPRGSESRDARAGRRGNWGGTLRAATTDASRRCRAAPKPRSRRAKRSRSSRRPEAGGDPRSEIVRATGWPTLNRPRSDAARQGADEPQDNQHDEHEAQHAAQACASIPTMRVISPAASQHDDQEHDQKDCQHGRSPLAVCDWPGRERAGPGIVPEILPPVATCPARRPRSRRRERGSPHPAFGGVVKNQGCPSGSLAQ